MKKDQHHHSTSLTTKSKVQKISYRKSISIKELERIAFEIKVKSNPNTPVEWLAKPKYRDDNANALTRCIIDFIRLTGGQAERISNIGRYLDTRYSFKDVVGRNHNIGNARWIKGTGTNGTADISAIIEGLSVKIEVKYGKDRQSEAQRLYQSQVEQAGGLYFIATSFEQFFNWYHQNFLGHEYKNR